MKRTFSNCNPYHDILGRFTNKNNARTTVPCCGGGLKYEPRNPELPYSYYDEQSQRHRIDPMPAGTEPKAKSFDIKEFSKSLVLEGSKLIYDWEAVGEMGENMKKWDALSLQEGGLMAHKKEAALAVLGMIPGAIELASVSIAAGSGETLLPAKVAATAARRATTQLIKGGIKLTERAIAQLAAAKAEKAAVTLLEKKLTKSAGKETAEGLAKSAGKKATQKASKAPTSTRAARKELKDKFPEVAENVQFHHIDPVKFEKTELTNIAKQGGYEVHCPENTILLPNKAGVLDTTRPWHRGSHPNYSKEIEYEREKIKEAVMKLPEALRPKASAEQLQTMRDIYRNKLRMGYDGATRLSVFDKQKNMKFPQLHHPDQRSEPSRDERPAPKPQLIAYRHPEPPYRPNNQALGRATPSNSRPQTYSLQSSICRDLYACNANLKFTSGRLYSTVRRLPA